MSGITAHEKAFNVFNQFADGITAIEFADLLDSGVTKKPSAIISLFVLQGLAKVDGRKINPATGNLVKIYKPTGIPFSERASEYRAPSRRRKRPTDSELLELRKFKKDAIARFPELGVSSAVCAARKQLAGIYRADGDEAKAAMFEAGLMDDGEAMRIALAIAAK